MKPLFLNISFFTRIPVARWAPYTDETYEKSIKWFPYVGLIIGLITVLPNFLFIDVLHTKIPGAYMALMNIVVYLLVSGGIHLDGFSDTLDGLLSGRSGERIYEIMKDSRMGAFGTIGLCLYFLALYTFLQDINFYAIILMPYIGKVCASFIAGISEYPQDKSGMGSIFLQINTAATSTIHLIIGALICFSVLGISGMIAFGSALIISLNTRRWVIGKLNGVTGDPIGFIVESSHLIFIFMYQIVGYLHI